MFFTARPLTLLAVIFLLGACGGVAPVAPAPAPPRGDPPAASPPRPDTFQSSPFKPVGRILALDAPRGFAFVGLTAEPPAAALAEGAALITRTADLRETARLRVSRYVRGRTLGTQILSGRPSPGDEVIFQAP